MATLVDWAVQCIAASPSGAVSAMQRRCVAARETTSSWFPRVQLSMFMSFQRAFHACPSLSNSPATRFVDIIACLAKHGKQGSRTDSAVVMHGTSRPKSLGVIRPEIHHRQRHRGRSCRHIRTASPPLVFSNFSSINHHLLQSSPSSRDQHLPTFTTTTTKKTNFPTTTHITHTHNIHHGFGTVSV